MRGRSHSHDLGIDSSSGVGDDARHRFKAEFGSARGRHDDDGSAAIIDAAGVGSGHGAVLVKGRLEAGDGFEGDSVTDKLVGIEEHRRTFALWNRHGDNLILEPASFLRGFRLVLGSDGEDVLFLAGDVELLGNVLGGDAHVVLVVDIPETVDDHAVHKAGVAHAETVTRALEDVWGGAHVLLATGDDDVRITGDDSVGCCHNGLQSGAADAMSVMAGRQKEDRP